MSARGWYFATPAKDGKRKSTYKTGGVQNAGDDSGDEGCAVHRTIVFGDGNVRVDQRCSFFNVICGRCDRVVRILFFGRLCASGRRFSAIGNTAG